MAGEHHGGRGEAGVAREHPGPTVAGRVLAVLAAFDADHRSLRLSEIARRADLPLSTAHRLVGELEAWGALTRRPDGAYVIGARLWRTGLLTPLHAGLREAANPFLNDVHAATLATVHLAVRDGMEVLYVDRLMGTASVPIVSTVGSRLPLHATADGKILLAHAPAAVRAEALRRLTRVTAYTVTHPGVLTAQLERALTDGHATTHEEMSLGAGSLAVPVVRSDGTVVASLGVVVPDVARERTRLLAALHVAARGIGRALG